LAPATEKDDVAAEAEEGEDEEPESSSYRVTPEEPRAAAVRLQVPAEAKLIGGKTIRFLGLTSGGHERQFLEEAGASFAIPHEEEHFGKLTAAELTTACGDLSLKAFIASRCLARRLEQESKESKEKSVLLPSKPCGGAGGAIGCGTGTHPEAAARGRRRGEVLRSHP
jgi:hypothetical protein